MKALKITIAVLLLFICCNNPDKSLGIIDPTVNENEHLKYFGFTLIDTYWDDPTDSQTKTNYSDEVAPFSNVADILVVLPTDNVIARMQSMQQLQMKSMLYITELFFEIEGTAAPSGNDYALRSDYQSRWDTFVDTNSLGQHKNLIQTFYLGEEPTWNGISANELKTASEYVKASIQDVPILIIESFAAVNDLEIPNAVDWVGFDHYFVKDPLNDSTFLAELETIKSKLSNTQSLVLVMDTHYIDFAHGAYGDISLNEMEDVAKSYYELAKKEEKTIALLAYFWPSGFDQTNSIGARHMPENVKNEYRRIGKEISGKQ